MADLPSYTVTQPRPGVWTFRFPWSDCTASYNFVAAAAPSGDDQGVLITRRNGAVFWANPDWEPAATVVPLMLADAWDKGLLGL